MATEKLLPNAEDGGWVGGTGAATDIDEGIAGADGAYLSCVLDDDVVVIDLSASAVVDGDTVTALDIVIHALSNGASSKDTLDVELLIGGSLVGVAQNTGNLTGSMASYSVNDVAWDADKTAAEMDGAQVRLTHRQTGKAETVDTRLDTFDVDVVYTEAVTDISLSPPTAELVLSESAPTLTIPVSPLTALSQGKLGLQNSFHGPFEV